ncbi:MAG: hypothetical protein LBC43_02135, partial [Bifidobacteriaceae bacterium]|nr:hypothetical protein [Bifidobacteriaceae bacterium]
MSDLISKIDELKSVNAFQSIQVVVPNQSAGRQLKRELVAGQSYVNLEIVTIQQLVHNAAAQHFSDRPPLTLSARCLMLMLLFKNSKFSSRQCPNLAKVSSQFSTIEYLARKSQDLDWYNGLDQLQLSEVGQEMVDLHLELKKRWSEYYTEADVLRFLIQNSKFIIHNSRSLGAGTGIENVSNSRSSSNSRSGSSAEIEDSRPKSAKIPAGSNQEILLGYGLERRFLPDLTYSMLENVCSELFPASVPENLRAETPTVTVSKASNLDDESRLAVRQVLQWVQEGVPASEIAITFNTDSGYSKLIRNYLKEASLPIAGGNPTKLIDSWAYQNFIDY